MKPTLKMIPFVLALSLFAGCATTPAGKIYQFRQSVVTLKTGIDELAVGGKLTSDQAKSLLHLLPLLNAAERAVVGLKTVGGSPLDAALSAAQSVLSELIAIEADGKKRL